MLSVLLAGCAGDSKKNTSSGADNSTTSDSVATTDQPDMTFETSENTSATSTKGDQGKTVATTKKAGTTTTKKESKPLDSSVITWFEGPLTDIFPETVKTGDSLSAGHIDVCKNETESIQIGVRASKEELTNLRVTVKPFSGSNAPKIMVAPIRLVYNSKPSYGFTSEGGYSAKYSRGTSPKEFPEYYDTINNVVGLAKGITYSIPAGQSAGIVVEVTTTSSTPAGTYNTTVELSGDQGSRSIPITVKVWNITLPEPKNSTFSYTNWFVSSNFLTDGFPSFMDAYYDAGSFNDNFFTVMANYAKVMKKQRQNVIFVPIQALLSSDMTIDSSGNYKFTFKNFDRYIETFLKNGSVKALEGSFFYDKDWYINPPSGKNQWPQGELVTPIFVKSNGKVTTKWVYAESEEANRHFDQLIPALYSHLKSKGWSNIWLQHVCDEPLSEIQSKQISRMYKRILKDMPGVRTLDAGSHQLTNFKENEMRIYCPQLDDYERNRNGYNTVNKSNLGIDVWMYTCVNPQGNYMTRIADYPLLSARVMGWYIWQQGLKGYLHWGWNLWNQAVYSRNDPFYDMYCDSAAGDAFLVYPDSANMSVFEGPRSTSVRDSWEDYELLMLASKKNASKTKQIVDTVVKSGDNFIRDNKKLIEYRMSLLQIAAQ